MTLTGDRVSVVGLKWKEFQTYFRATWEPGQHVSYVGPTGTGKTTVNVGILPMRKYVLALDAKGGDSTLAGLLQHGFERSEWPPSKEIRERIEDNKPSRLLIGSQVKHVGDMPKLKQQVRRVLRDAFNETGWTVYLDELQIVTDKRLMNLGAGVELNLIAARDRRVSMVMSFQRPANVPRSAAEMSTFFVTFYTRDTDTVGRLAEMAGRSAAEMRGLIRGLEPYSVLVFNRDPRQPVIVTRATA